ncbi:hypothetical protein [Micromonospora sp. CPCC 206061]|uniref:hypothetical protein n=1 Tax=Micromonospora sp. CPCC 206061 TaxID=3122410 RepID=UPI002FEEBA53
MTGPRIRIAVATGAFLCAALAGVVASTSIHMATAACLALVLFLVFAVDRSGGGAFITSLLLFLACAVSIAQIAEYTELVRALAIMVLALGAVCGVLDATRPGNDRLRSARPLLAVYLVGMVGYFVAATLPFDNTKSLVTGILGLASLTVYVLLTTKLLAPHTLDVALVAVLASVIIVSLVLGFVLPDIAVLGGRLRGISANPNLLGVYAFLLVAAVVLRRRPWPLTLWAALLGVATLVWTASRGSALSLAIALVVGAVMNAGRARQLALPLLTLGAVSVALTNYSAEFAGIKLFRANNSREAGVQEVLDLVRAGVLGGVGIGNERGQIASSPLRAFTYGGVVALCCILLIWLAILWFSWQSGPATFAFGLGVVVHSNFEGWMVSATGPIVVLFALMWVSMLLSGPQIGADRRPSHAAGAVAVTSGSGRTG